MAAVTQAETQALRAGMDAVADLMDAAAYPDDDELTLIDTARGYLEAAMHEADSDMPDHARISYLRRAAIQTLQLADRWAA